MQARIPPPIVAAFVVAVMVFAARTPFALAFDTGINPWLAALLIAAGASIALLGVVQFRRHRTTVDPLHPTRASQLVTNGVYRISRNPMYLGLLSTLLGIGVALGSGAAVLIALGFVPLLTALQIKAEEAAMRTLFGEAFEHYAARVRRWL